MVDDPRSFFDSSYAKGLIDNNHCISFNRLDESIDSSGIERNLCILGLEDGWTSDAASDRRALNRLREYSDLNIYLLVVSFRNGLSCKPSSIVSDY